MKKKWFKEETKTTEILQLVRDNGLKSVAFTNIAIMGSEPLDVIKQLNAAGVSVEIGGTAKGRPNGTKSSEEIVDAYSEVVVHLELGESVRTVAADLEVSPTTVQKVRRAMESLGHVFPPKQTGPMTPQQYYKNNQALASLLMSRVQDEEILSKFRVHSATINRLKKVLTELGYNFEDKDSTQEKFWDSID